MLINFSSLFTLCLFALAACEPAEPGACHLADENLSCPECYDGDVSCSYEDIVVTEPSCGGCQAASALYAAYVQPTPKPQKKRS